MFNEGVFALEPRGRTVYENRGMRVISFLPARKFCILRQRLPDVFARRFATAAIDALASKLAWRRRRSYTQPERASL